MESSQLVTTPEIVTGAVGMALSVAVSVLVPPSATPRYLSKKKHNIKK
jgi:hypothetical protein